MDTQEAQETATKEARGRQAKVIPITVNLSHADHHALLNLTLKKMKQLGEDVPRDRVISEALQALAKTLNSQDG